MGTGTHEIESIKYIFIQSLYSSLKYLFTRTPLSFSKKNPVI